MFRLYMLIRFWINTFSTLMFAAGKDLGRWMQKLGGKRTERESKLNIFELRSQIFLTKIGSPKLVESPKFCFLENVMVWLQIKEWSQFLYRKKKKKKLDFSHHRLWSLVLNWHCHIQDSVQIRDLIVLWWLHSFLPRISRHWIGRSNLYYYISSHIFFLSS